MYQIVRACGLRLLWSAGMIATLAACGGSATTAPTVTPAPSAVGSATAPNEPRSQNCGTIQTRGPDTVAEPSAQRSEDCIWQAYQQCATMGTATVTIQAQASPEREIFTTRDFTVQGSGGVCTIQEMVKSQVFAAPPNAPTTTTETCAGLTRDPNGTLHFQACGKDGEIIVAPPKP